MTNEGDQSPADVLITVDAGRLVRAKMNNLLQGITSSKLDTIIPSSPQRCRRSLVRFNKRARVIAYSKDRINRKI